MSTTYMNRSLLSLGTQSTDSMYYIELRRRTRLAIPTLHRHLGMVIHSQMDFYQGVALNYLYM
jgi:hypothetical protein